MKNTFTWIRLLSLALVIFTLFTACRKSVDTTGADRPYTAGGPSLVDLANSWRYRIFDRDNNTAGYFRIIVDKGGYARVTLEELRPSLFWGIYPVEAAFYNGNSLYAQLNTPTSDQRTWTTYPVRLYSTGTPIKAAELKEMTGLKIMLATPGEVAGIGFIQ